MALLFYRVRPFHTVINDTVLRIGSDGAGLRHQCLPTPYLAILPISIHLLRAGVVAIPAYTSHKHCQEDKVPLIGQS